MSGKLHHRRASKRQPYQVEVSITDQARLQRAKKHRLNPWLSVWSTEPLPGLFLQTEFSFEVGETLRWKNLDVN
jgi:hypothetical protein